MDEVLVERVLRAVEQVPAGRVVSYGDLGALVGVGPRHVGRVMSQWGGNVAWWRVTNRSGDLPPELRGLLRQLSTDRRIRWVEWKQGNVVMRQGYVLTGYGEAALDVYLAAYGPVRPRLAEVALENRRADLLFTMHARVEALV